MLANPNYSCQGAKATPAKKEPAKSGVSSKSGVTAPSAGAKPAAGGGVSEEEAKALLRSSGPIKSQDLVAKFKSRLKTQEVCKTSRYVCSWLMSVYVR